MYEGWACHFRKISQERTLGRQHLSQNQKEVRERVIKSG